MPTSLKRRAAPDESSSGGGIGDIQPLRDLAKNFDIDIEPYLEEFLRLTTEVGDEDGGDGRDGGGGSGTKTQNFATAALKIQNSVGIYNRKVDFLHKVVYEVFHDFIQSTINSKKRPSSATKGGGGSDSAIDTFRDFDPEMEFLLLDDVLPRDKSEGRRKINLKEEEQRPSSDVNATGVNLDTTMATSAGGNGGNNNNGGTTPNNMTLLSLGGVMSATRMMDQNGTFLISRQSLDRASPSAMSRMLMANLQGGAGPGNGGEGHLRLVAGMCDVGSNGALLMPGTKASVFVNGESQAERTANAATNAEDVQIFPEGLSPGPPDDQNDGSNDFGAADNHAEFGNNGDDWGGDDDDHGVGFQLNDDPPENHFDDEGEEKNDDHQATAHNASLNNNDENRQPPKVEMEDPWAVLDPHEPSNDRAQPLRIGVTIRLPPELEEDDRPSASVTGSRTRTKKKGLKKKRGNAVGGSSAAAANDFLTPPFLANVTLDEAMMRDDDDGNNGNFHDPLNNSDDTTASLQQLENNKGRHLKVLQQLRQKKLIFGEEFAHVARAHAKRRDVLRKQRRIEQQQRREAQTKAEVQNVFDDGDDDYGGGGGFDFGGGDDDDGSFGQHDDNENRNNDENEQSIHRSNVDFNAIDDAFGGDGNDGGGFDDHNHDGNFPNSAQQQTFEELCRAHLRKFAKSAEIYAAETQLTKRVGAWQTSLAPLLEEQEKRPVFDIHSCGRQILQSVERNLSSSVRKRMSTGEKKLESSSSSLSSNSSQKNKNAVGFSKIFPKDVENYEVCRLFLSTLMLCNCGNVTVHKNGGDGDGGIESLDSLSIELLDSTFQPPMESFVAPSANAVEDLQQNNENSMASPNLGMVDENVEIV